MKHTDYEDLKLGTYYCMYTDANSPRFSGTQSEFTHIINVIQIEYLGRNEYSDMIRLFVGTACARKKVLAPNRVVHFEGSELVDFSQETMQKFEFWELSDEEIHKHLIMETI